MKQQAGTKVVSKSSGIKPLSSHHHLRPKLVASNRLCPSPCPIMEIPAPKLSLKEYDPGRAMCEETLDFNPVFSKTKLTCGQTRLNEESIAIHLLILPL